MKNLILAMSLILIAIIATSEAKQGRYYALTAFLFISYALFKTKTV